jgi:hypothetical protein
MKRTDLVGVLCLLLAGINVLIPLIGCGGGGPTGTSVNLIGNVDHYRHITYKLADGERTGQIFVPIFRQPRKDEYGKFRVYEEVIEQMNVLISRQADNSVTLTMLPPSGVSLEGGQYYLFGNEFLVPSYSAESPAGSQDIVESRGPNRATESVRRSQGITNNATQFMAGATFVPGNRMNGGKITLPNPPANFEFNLLITTIPVEDLRALAAAAKAAPNRK